MKTTDQPIFAPCVLALELLSVYALCLFHIWPSEFSNGFLGADVLFIIWGFVHTFKWSINAKAYKAKAKHVDILKQLLVQYWMELRQILFTISITICATLIAGRILLFERELNALLDDIPWALFLGINHKLTEQDWISELIGLTNSRPLFHFWVPSVLVQYLIVFPTIFLILRFLARKLKNLSNVSAKIFLPCAFAICAIPSISFWLWSPGRAVSMGWLFARAWQFLMGAIAFLAIPEKIVQNENALKNENLKICRSPKSIAEHLLFYTLAICLASMLCMPSLLWPAFFQFKTLLALVVCLLAGILLFMHPSRLKKNVPPNAISQWMASHFGQFPFVLFLLHLPVQVFFSTYVGMATLNIEYGFFALALITLVALIVHLSISQIIMRISDSKLRIALFLAYALCVLGTVLPNNVAIGQHVPKVSSNFIIFNKTTGKITQAPSDDLSTACLLMEQLQQEEYRGKLLKFLGVGQKVKLNELLKKSFVCDPTQPMPRGNFTEEFVEENGFITDRRHVNRIVEWKIKGNGTKNVLMFGNSHAQVLWKEVEQILPDYATFHVVAAPACMPVFERDWRTIYGIPCAQVHNALMNTLQKHRPDVLILIFKWYEELSSVPIASTLQEDDTFSQLQSFFNKASQFVGDKIFLSAPNLLFNVEIAHRMAMGLWKNASVQELNKKYSTHMDGNRWNYARMNAIKCNKCTVIDFTDVFCNSRNQNGTATDRICHAFDPITQLALFSDTNHLSFIGRLWAKQFLRQFFN